MSSKSILSVGVKSPARAFMRPALARSILRRPTPLPLSPNPLPYAASFSVVLSSAKLSPHVHFPTSPSIAATFSAFSPNSYDRTAIMISPFSAEITPPIVPVVSRVTDSFKLSSPPKRKSTASAKSNTLTVPVLEEPRSPKPYRPRAGVSFQELVIQVPLGSTYAGELSKSLYTYPRSPFPSAPVTAREDLDTITHATGRGRKSLSNDKAPHSTRAKSLENKSKRRKNIGLDLAPSRPGFLSPVHEPLLGPDANSAESTLSQAFWQSVSLDEGLASASPASARPEPVAMKSLGLPMMFGNKDGSVWSPQLRKQEKQWLMLSPTKLSVPRKGTVASPSPNDPAAAFPSFSFAIRNMDQIIPYPPRAVMEGA